MINKEEVTIIIPVYNEASSIEQVLTDIQDNYYGSEIIVINDGSVDGTIEKIGSFDIKIIHHHNNKGYGAALKSGIKLAKNNIIVSIDADGQHDVKDIKLLLQYADLFDMVVGRRTGKSNIKLWKDVGRYILSFFANMAVGFKIHDVNSGLRIYKKNVISKYLDFLPNSFSFTTTSTLISIFNSHKIKFIPINVYACKGAKVSFKSGFVSLAKILILSFLFKPARGILLMLYILDVCLFLVACALRSKLLLFSILLSFMIVVMVDKLCQCDKNLISS